MKIPIQSRNFNLLAQLPILYEDISLVAMIFFSSWEHVLLFPPPLFASLPTSATGSLYGISYYIDVFKYATFNSHTACRLKEIHFKLNLDISFLNLWQQGLFLFVFFEKNTQKTTKITTKKTPKIKIKTEPLDLYLQKVNLNIDFRYLCSSCFT